MPPIPLEKLKEQLETAAQPVRELIERQKSATLLLGAGLLIAIDVIFLVLPMTGKAYRNHTHLSELRQDIAEIRSDVKGEEKLKASLAAAEKLLAERERMLAVGDISFYLETLSAIAQDAGVRIRSVRPMAARESEEMRNRKKDGEYEAAYFEITASGGYHELGRFMERIENERTFIKITRIDVRATAESAREHDINIVIKMLRKG